MADQYHIGATVPGLLAAHELRHEENAETLSALKAQIEKASRLNAALKECISDSLNWIDSVPQSLALPVMPGFDRDRLDEVRQQTIQVHSQSQQTETEAQDSGAPELSIPQLMTAHEARYQKECQQITDLSAQAKALDEHNVNLRDCLGSTLEWIDSVPQSLALPVMPGFDRDYVEQVLQGNLPDHPEPVALPDQEAQIEKAGRIKNENKALAKNQAWYSNAMEVLLPLRFHLESILEEVNIHNRFIDTMNKLQPGYGSGTRINPTKVEDAQKALAQADLFFTRPNAGKDRVTPSEKRDHEERDCLDSPDIKSKPDQSPGL